MDDTTTATPPSTAASAAAVADTKVSPGPGHHHVAATENSSNLELVIKSSNQQYDDIVVKSDMLWTVRHLKKQLSIVYPGKPLIEDQKLIYSGKLLKDAEKLNEVIRNYKDVFTQKHIFHLVCATKHVTTPIPKASSTATRTATTPAPAARNGNQNPTAMSAHVASTSDGLRQRNTGQQQQAAQQEQRPMITPEQMFQRLRQYGAWPPDQQVFSQRQLGTQNAENATAANSTAGGSTTSGAPYVLQGFGQQQFHAMAMYNAWMQQTYAQYMQQMTHGYSAESADIPPNPYLQQMPYVVPNVGVGATLTPIIPASYPRFNTVTSAAATAVPRAETSVQEQQPIVVAAQAPPPAVAPADAPAGAVAAPAGDELAAQRRFPNIQEEPENRDWLENFFALTRMAIFITILYFNSSPLRCLLVVLIASGIYLYHIGVLRRRRERNNNNINRNNNAAAEAAAQIQRFMDEQNLAAQPAAEQGDNPQNAPVDGEVAAAPAVPAAADAVDAGAAAANVNAPTGAADNGVATVQPENSASVISIVRTFVITFFTSLLPEAPAV